MFAFPALNLEKHGISSSRACSWGGVQWEVHGRNILTKVRIKHTSCLSVTLLYITVLSPFLGSFNYILESGYYNNNNNNYYFDGRNYFNLFKSIQSAAGLKALKPVATGCCSQFTRKRLPYLFRFTFIVCTEVCLTFSNYNYEWNIIFKVRLVVLIWPSWSAGPQKQ